MAVLIIGWIILIGTILYQRDVRNTKYSITCPNCGHKIKPQLTGIRYKYKYKCKNCGCYPYGY